MSKELKLRKVMKPSKKGSIPSKLIKLAVKKAKENRLKKKPKYLVIDEDYNIYKTDVLTGKLRAKGRIGELSIIRISDFKGMNTPEYAEEVGEEWSDINDLKDI